MRDRRFVSFCYVVCTVLVAFAMSVQPAGAGPEGRLVLVGGGPTPAQVFERTLTLSGGHRAIVAVVPQTFTNDTIADAAVVMWRTFQPREVVKVSRTDPSAMRDALERATLVWMPGGFPGFLMRSIADTPIPEMIRARFEAGVTIGGASAGAMAMSRTMIADEASPDGRLADGPSTVEGLGLWPEAIVSAHFTERRRLGPLLPILDEHPTLFGIGIDEGTGVIVQNGEFEVIGRGTVVVIDPHNARTRTLKAGAHVRYALRP
jgi:cyanophycinase